jgi:DNA-dependent protein kinase catalytic subunit
VQRTRNFIKSSQQLDWTQTQSGEVDSDSRNTGLVPKAFKMAPIYAPSQALIDRNQTLSSLPSFLSLSTTQNLVPISQVSQVSRSQFSQTQGGGSAGSMAPPQSLPSRFAVKAVITQRMPHRFGVSSAGSTESSLQRGMGDTARSSKGKFYSSNVKIAQRKRQEKSARNAKVSLYRRYRSGELPDIKVLRADFIKPFQAMCLLDETFASSAVSVFFDAIFKSCADNAAVTASLRRCLKSVLSAGGNELERVDVVACNNQVLSCVLACSLNCLKIENESLAESQVAPQSHSYISNLSGGRTAAVSSDSRGNSRGHRPTLSATMEDEYFISDLSPAVVYSAAAQSLNYYSGENADFALVIILTHTYNMLLFSSYLGILLIEEQIRTLSVRSAATTITGGSYRNNWAFLSRLYEALGEKDTLVGGVFSKVSAIPDTRLGLEAEISGNYPEAVSIYNNLIEKYGAVLDDSGAGQSPVEGVDVGVSDINEEIDFWDERSLECLRQLLDWKQLEQKIDSVASNWLDRTNLMDVTESGPTTAKPWKQFILNPLANSRKRNVLIPLKMGCLINIDFKEDESRELAAELSAAPKDSTLESLRRLLESVYPNDLASLYAVTGDWIKVKATVDTAYDVFLKQWSSLHACATEARRELLLQIQRVVELEDGAALKLCKSSPQLGHSAARSALLQRWKTSAPLLSDPPRVWSDILRGRRLLLDNDGGAAAALHLADLHVTTARAAVHQFNSHLVRGQLSAGNKLRQHASAMLKQTASESSSGGAISLEEVVTVCTVNRLALDKLGSLFNEEIHSKAVQYYNKTMALLQSKLTSTSWGTGIDDMSDKANLSLIMADWLRVYWNKIGSPTVGDQFSKALEAIDIYRSITRQISSDITSEIAGGAKLSIETIPRAYVRTLGRAFSDYATFCAELRSLDVTATDLAPQCVYAYLNGLFLGNRTCREKVVLVLRIIGDLYCKSSDQIPSDICARITRVPSWIYIRHCAQLMGTLDRPEGKAAIIALEHVAAHYPFALCYNFKITSENLGTQGRALIPRLQRLLHSPAVDSFVAALEGLTHADLRLVDNLKEILQVQKNTAKNVAVMSETQKRDLVEMLNKCKIDSTSERWPHVGDKIGSYNKVMSKECRKFFDSELKTGFKLDDNTVIGLLTKARSNIPKRFETGKVNISEFSQWLADFDSNTFKIEVPGQYISDTDVEPDMSRHAMISGFDPIITVMPSIRRPKRLTILGTAGQEYKVLVKGGEDLRNDERVEQLFATMNSIVTSASLAAGGAIMPRDLEIKAGGHFMNSVLGTGRGLHARTFGVVPMTSKLGILEWVSDTMPMKAIITEEMSKDAQFVAANSRGAAVSGRSKQAQPTGVPLALDLIEASSLRRQWLESEGGYDGTIRKLSAGGGRGKGISSGSATEVWHNLQSKVPNDFLRRFLVTTATTPEAFYTFRGEFSRSLAVSCVYGYFLGLGDRHLDNLLVDCKSGAIILIDFGICFGIGASSLPVPELIPFRLTAQLTSILSPLDTVDMLRHYMIQCLSGIRSAEGISRLVSDLDVYLNDPVVDWLRGSGTSKDAINELRNELTWEPKRRIEVVIQKLKGVSPVTILLEDLKRNPSVKKNNLLQGYCNLLDTATLNIQNSSDSGPRNERKRKASDISTESAIESYMSPSSQADILIAMATSPEILCRMYEGLLTWI